MNMIIMKRAKVSYLFVLALVSVILAGCSSARYSSHNYTVTQGFALDNIERDSESFIPISDDICYVDGLRFITTFDGIRSTLQIKNESGRSVKVLWDDGALIDQENIAHRIIHSGIKITDKEKAQVPSVIPDDSSISDTIYASDCLEWNVNKGDWDYIPLVWDQTFSDEQSAMSYINNMAPVKLMLPIENNGELTEYLISFKESGSLINVKNHSSLSTGSIIALGVVGSLVTGLLGGLIQVGLDFNID